MKQLTDFSDAHLRIFDRKTPEDASAVESVYLIGICGTGMGSLAGLLLEKGYSVRGSDENVWPPMSTRLEELGIDIDRGYSADHLDPVPDLVIVGNACTPTHPEAAATRERGLVQQSFPEALAQFFIDGRRSLVVAGTHGKTTTTSMLIHVLRHANRDPGFLVGGVMSGYDRSYAVGSGAHFVVEGDEYDSAYFDKRPKFLHYRPHGAIVTSLEFDHADIYDSIEDYRKAFRTFTGLLPADGTLVLCADENEVSDLGEYSNASVVRYGLQEDVDVTAVDIVPSESGQTFTLVVRGEPVRSMMLPMNGRHNLLNALSVAALALAEGLTPDEIANGLASFEGVKRRQEVRGEAGGVLVVDDFAHHPTAVRATIEAASERWPNRRLVAVFEPRSNSSRRRIFESGYRDAFLSGPARAVFLSRPPFRHNDRAEDFMDIDRLVEAIRAGGVAADAAEGADQLIPLILEETRAGDIVLVMSNGGFGDIHRKLLERLTAS